MVIKKPIWSAKDKIKDHNSQQNTVKRSVKSKLS